jgi:hypothetical protein
MHVTRTHVKDLARMGGDAGKQLGGILRVQPVQRPIQTIIVEVGRLYSWPQQVLHRFIGKELRYQVQAPITEPQPIQKHRDCGRSHADVVFRFTRQSIEVGRQSYLLTHSCHHSQVIQAFVHIAFGGLHPLLRSFGIVSPILTKIPISVENYCEMWVLRLLRVYSTIFF